MRHPYAADVGDSVQRAGCKESEMKG